MDDVEKAHLRVEIHNATPLCGSCQSATFMAWHDPHNTLDADDLPRGAVNLREYDTRYMIRCDYFRMTVPHPEKLTLCEAYKVEETDFDKIPIDD